MSFSICADTSMLNLVPRLFALVETKTLVGAGHVSRRKIVALGGVGKVSNYMLPHGTYFHSSSPCWTTLPFCVAWSLRF